MDGTAMQGAYDYAFGPGMNTQGIVIIRNAQTVGERYAEGRDDSSWAASRSTGKSLAATAVGVAVHEGLIECDHESFLRPILDSIQ